MSKMSLGNKQGPSLVAKPPTKTLSTNQTVLSINVNQEMAPSFDNQCMIAKGTQQQQAKKKRAALENISNANVNYSQISNATNATKASNEIAKKSRFAFGTHLPENPKIKKSESQLSKKANSKENINAPKQVKGKTTTQQSLVENSKLSKSANSIINLTQEKKPETVQILEPRMNLAESNEKLAVSSSSLNIEFKCEPTIAIELDEKTLDANSVLGWEDIDADDKDEFSCGDYVSQIFKYYRARESTFTVDDYIKRQPQINKQMRLLLVDWMVEVQQQLEFNHEVLYLSVKLLDLYLNKRRIEKEKLQLLGGAAMFIACKFEERMPPIIDDFIYVSDNAYDRNQLIKMEMDILKTVKFDIGIPLSYTFLRRYSKCIKADMRFLTLARYILELSLQDYNFAYKLDSQKACAALYLAMKMTVAYEKYVKSQTSSAECIANEQLIVSSANLTSTEWNPTLIHYTGSFLIDFVHLLPEMNNLLKTASSSKYKTIFKKYSHQVFYEVAKIAPLSDDDLEFLIENATINETKTN